MKVITILETGHIDLITLTDDFISDIVYNKKYYNITVGPIKKNNECYVMYCQYHDSKDGLNICLTDCLDLHIIGQSYILKYNNGNLESINKNEFWKIIKIVDEYINKTT